MPSGSTNSRKKMKKERPEKYQQYLDSQKKRSAEYRRKMKEAMENPTETDKEKRKRHLEKQRARMQRYLERKKRQKAASQSAPVDEDPASRKYDENEPVSSTSGNVDDILEGENVTHQETDKERQGMEIQSPHFISPSRDRGTVIAVDRSRRDEVLLQQNIENLQNHGNQPDSQLSNDPYIQNRYLRIPQEDGNSQLHMTVQDQDYSNPDQSFTDADMEVSESRYIPHQSGEITRSDDRPVDQQIPRHSARSNIDSWTQPVSLYHDPLTLRTESPDDSRNYTNSYHLQTHATAVNGSSDSQMDAHIAMNSSNPENSEMASNDQRINFALEDSIPRPVNSTESRQYINMDTGTQISMQSTLSKTGNFLPPPTSTRILLDLPTPTGFPLPPPTPTEIPLPPPTPTGMPLPPPTQLGISLPPPTLTEIPLPPPTLTGNIFPLPGQTGSPLSISTLAPFPPLPDNHQPSEMHFPPLNLSTRRSPSPLSNDTEMQIYSASSRNIVRITGSRSLSYLTTTQPRDPFTIMPQDGGEDFIMADRDLRNNVIISATVTDDMPFSSAASSVSDRILDSIAGPSLPAPTPYTRYRSQQISTPAAAAGRAPHYNACVEHPGEKVRMWCIDCDRLLCVECLPGHRRHVLTRYRMLEEGEIMRQVDVTIVYDFDRKMMMIGSVFYFHTGYSITTYNIYTDKTECIDIDDRYIRDMCVSPDNTSIWYCTNQRKVYEYDVENRTHQLRFTCDSDYTRGICATRSGHVVLGVERCSDDCYSDSDDSDDSDIERYRTQWYLQMYTQQDSYTKPTTSVCICGKRRLKYDVEPYYIRECPVTGDLLVTEIRGKTVLLTDNKCNTKYWFRGKTVKNKHGKRKRTGYDRRLWTSGAACFDKEGNILILNGYDKSVIVIDHDTGMYIRTVHQEPDICSICIQDNGLLWCWVGDRLKHKLKSIKYMEKLE